jgi:hypothetical protein
MPPHWRPLSRQMHKMQILRPRISSNADLFWGTAMRLTSRAEERNWYSEVSPWTEKQLEDYLRFHGLLVQPKETAPAPGGEAGAAA